MERVPTPIAPVVRVAAAAASGASPRDVVPSKNVTLPVGVWVPLSTLALNVTDWPNVDGFWLDVNRTVGFAWFTVCGIVALSLLKSLSPLYTALTVWPPAPRLPTTTCALSPVNAALPSEVVPS